MKGFPLRRTLAAATISISLLAGCITPIQNQSTRTPALSHIVSRWKNGSCSIYENQLSYSNNVARNSINLDLEAQSPSSIICSDDFTVIFTNNSVIVSIGAEDIHSGSEMLGEVSGQFVPANSYSINIQSITPEGIESSSIHGDILEIITRGSIWSIDLTNPHSGWSIY
ncbi:MAG: hypothetical protein ABH983_01390 [Candidatus Micrarchaeota archaeon]